MDETCEAPTSATTAQTEATGYKNVVYFMEWAIYARNFAIFDLDWSKITHVNYAFGKPTADGTVTIFDSWAALEKRWPDHGDSWQDKGHNSYGNLGHGFTQKLQNRGTKFGLSIALKQAGKDFIDIDWEYPVEGGDNIPHSPDDIANYVLLLREIREEFKTLPFQAELSVAAPVGYDKYRHWDFPAISSLVDHINIMAYDMAGSWSNYTDHQANLYEDPNHPAGLKYSAHTAVQDYIKGGCPSNKIVLGIPAYGRSFENTAGLYSSFTPPTKGSWVSGSDGAGVWDYKALPQAGATEFYDAKLGATYSYDPNAKMFISYEGPKSLAQKLDYIKKYNLGGTMFWPGDADFPTSNARSLIAQVYNYFGKDNMAFNTNNINYPTSPYDNVRNHSPPHEVAIAESM
ncbi:hypothetical protein Ae201684_013869 [Aphanomyces euteiches]|uniref:GH18 domain-containing protein n=1 Tax=Aphanomyces euteiches TaxID=100861 RepID=A0A6G0WLZ8_9STRA|nr:hypothetical protein Ae201684_013869 [Aphanomyces euteiches]